MRIRVVVLPTGEVGLFSEQGSFAEGQEKLTRLLTELGAAGIQFAEVGDVEQHRHDEQHAHEHTREGEHGHGH